MGFLSTNYQDMKLFSKTNELLLWLLPKTEAFPKTYRNTLTIRIVNSAFDFLDTIHAARIYQRDRSKWLHAADIALCRLRSYLRLVHQLCWINDGQYRHVSLIVDEMGRLLGGWIKSTTRLLTRNYK